MYNDNNNTNALIYIVFSLLGASFVAAFMAVMIGQGINSIPITPISYTLYDMAKKLVVFSIVAGVGSIGIYVFGLVKAFKM